MSSRMGGPPKCTCGRYAAGECVDCGQALCERHIEEGSDDRIRCGEHHVQRIQAQQREDELARVAAERERARAEAEVRAAELERAAILEAQRREIRAAAKKAARQDGPNRKRRQVPFALHEGRLCNGCMQVFVAPPVYETPDGFMCLWCTQDRDEREGLVLAYADEEGDDDDEEEVGFSL